MKLLAVLTCLVGVAYCQVPDCVRNAVDHLAVVYACGTDFDSLTDVSQSM
jgi:hypothetical protein